MKSFSRIALAVGVIALWSGTNASWAQAPSQLDPQIQGQMPTPAPMPAEILQPGQTPLVVPAPGAMPVQPAAPAAVSSPQPASPTPIVIETKVDLTTDNPGPQDPRAAREEAVAGLAFTKSECRHEASREAQQQCLKQAQEDYNALMAQGARSRRR